MQWCKLTWPDSSQGLPCSIHLRCIFRLVVCCQPSPALVSEKIVHLLFCHWLVNPFKATSFRFEMLMGSGLETKYENVVSGIQHANIYNTNSKLIVICRNFSSAWMAALHFYMLVCGFPVKWWPLLTKYWSKLVAVTSDVSTPFILIYWQSVGHHIKIQCCHPGRGEVQAKQLSMFVSIYCCKGKTQISLCFIISTQDLDTIHSLSHCYPVKPFIVSWLGSPQFNIKDVQYSKAWKMCRLDAALLYNTSLITRQIMRWASGLL